MHDVLRIAATAAAATYHYCCAVLLLLLTPGFVTAGFVPVYKLVPKFSVIFHLRV